jgi:hypothetical protein
VASFVGGRNNFLTWGAYGNTMVCNVLQVLDVRKPFAIAIRKLIWVKKVSFWSEKGGF